MAQKSEPDGASTEVEQLRRALAREERIGAALREVGNALGTTLDLDDLLELILGRLTDLLDADRSTLYLLDETRGDLVSRLVIGDQVRSIRVKVGHGIAGTVAKTGKPIRVAHAYDDPRFEREWDILTGYETSSMLAAPMKNHLGRTIGVIQVLNKKSGGEFTPEDEAILLALSTQAAVAIDNSRLFLSLIQKNRQLLETKEQLERRVTDLQLLFELEQATSRAQSVEDLLKAALLALVRACRARGGVVLLSEEESGDLIEYIYDEEQPDKLSRTGVKANDGFLGHSMRNPGVLQVDHAAGDERLSPELEARYPFPVTSVIATQLEGAEERAIGAMGVFSKRRSRPFSAEDISLLELVSANVSTAVRLFRAHEARERGERLTSIGRLLSQVIHDFKTPMTVISGHVQLMQHSDKAEDRADHAAKILKQFEVLTAMQREVLAFARGETNVFVRKVYLHQFFGDLREQLAQHIDGRAMELELDVDNKVVARFDEARVARAVMNLARNAIEAMVERGGTLTMTGKMVGSDLVIGVADTGPGIPKEIEGRLFQSFVTAGKEDGTGLGLAIVKKIVEEHGGEVRVTSSDRGAAFELVLPQGDVAPAKKKTTNGKSKPNGQGAKSRAKNKSPSEAPSPKA